jgi:hypothetical protein
MLAQHAVTELSKVASGIAPLATAGVDRGAGSVPIVPRAMGADVRLVIPGDGCLLYRGGNLADYAGVLEPSASRRRRDCAFLSIVYSARARTLTTWWQPSPKWLRGPMSWPLWSAADRNGDRASCAICYPRSRREVLLASDYPLAGGQSLAVSWAYWLWSSIWRSGSS